MSADQAVTMDLKCAGNPVYLVGTTKDELGGSHFALVNGLTGGQVPTVDAAMARVTFAAMHTAIRSGCVAACHDLSEGGLATAAAEMAFAGGMGVQLSLDAVEVATGGTSARLFSESNTRFLVEVKADRVGNFETALAAVACQRIGEVTETGRLTITEGDQIVVDGSIDALQGAWLSPLDWGPETTAR